MSDSAEAEVRLQEALKTMRRRMRELTIDTEVPKRTDAILQSAISRVRRLLGWR
jgi:hypothetical protein